MPSPGLSLMRGIHMHSGMALVSRGRLSVQRVEQAAWDAIQTMADKGGWGEGRTKSARSRKKQTPGGEEGAEEPPSGELTKAKGNPRKRKVQEAERDEDSVPVPVRRSARTRTKG